MGRVLSVVRLLLLGLLAFINFVLVFIVVSMVVSDGGLAVVISLAVMGGLVALGFTPLGENYFRAINRLRQPTVSERNRLEPLLERVLQQGPPGEKPGLFIHGDTFPNAMAIGRRTVAVTEGLLHHADDEEVMGVLAHELAHLRNGDTKVLLSACILNTLGHYATVAITFILAAISVVAEIVGQLRGLGFLAALPIIALVWFFRAVTWLIQKAMDLSFLAIGRQQEFAADAYAARLGFGPGLKRFLGRIQHHEGGSVQGLMGRMFASHPDTSRRMERLEQLLEQLRNETVLEGGKDPGGSVSMQ